MIYTRLAGWWTAFLRLFDLYVYHHESEELSADVIKNYLTQPTCPYCAGYHIGSESPALACPRVKRFVLGTDSKPHEVEFWPWGKWPMGKIVFLEDLPYMT